MGILFSRDADLVLIDPDVWRDVQFVSQRRLEGVGDLFGMTLTLTSWDVDFEQGGVGAGDVVVVGGTACEVVSRDGATTLTVRRIRPGEDSPSLGLPSALGVPVVVHSFEAQRDAANQSIRRWLSLGSGVEPVDPGALRRLEALLALAEVWRAAASLAPAGSPAHARAERFRRDAQRERARAGIGVDIGGDGEPDARRHAAVIVARRA